MARYPQIADAVIHIEPPPRAVDRLARLRFRASIRVTSPGTIRGVRGEKDRRARGRRRNSDDRRRSAAPADQARDRQRVVSSGSSAGVLRVAAGVGGSAGHEPRVRPVADGNTGAADPSTFGGGETDKHLIYEGLSRVAADGVLAGRAKRCAAATSCSRSGTPSSSRCAARSACPAIPRRSSRRCSGIASTQADVQRAGAARHRHHRAHRRRDMATRAARSRPWIETLVMPDATALWRGVRQAARARHRPRSVIGGRTLARALIDAGLVQDLYLTTAAKPAAIRRRRCIRGRCTARDRAQAGHRRRRRRGFRAPASSSAGAVNARL